MVNADHGPTARQTGARRLPCLLRPLKPLVLAAIFAGCAMAPALAEAPARVVSMNLCTDQLAMMLAPPGQLVSVSNLASDPLSSSMVVEAAAYPPNRGGAEQIFLLKPDLVLTGTYNSLASVALLRSLDITVVQVPPITSLAEVPQQILVVGQALGREEAAQVLVDDFNAGLAALAYDGPKATAAMYYANGYTSGAGTLADDVLSHVGFHNMGGESGLTGGGTLPLERLIMAAPQLVVTATPYPAASRAEEVLSHPALVELRARSGFVATTDADWVCGTPYILRAIAQMKNAREALE